MTRSSRRGVLSGLAILAASGLPASATAVPTPDAHLITACARYLELERIMANPYHPEHALDCDKMAEWPEYEALAAALVDAEPQTPEGWTALAGVALLCDAAIEDGRWNDGEEAQIAWKVLAHLAGPAVVQEEERRAEERARRSEAALQRINAEAAARPAPEPYRDTRTPQQKLEGARMMVRVAEGMLRDAEAEVAAAVAA